ncbi:MAG: aminotransferase class V-fold PLP-dependent enzyme, partial [Clostridiales bacterium]|nr:aminotransferase class V-fold PLP-dependent enzyme [Clostridiales bacterium]
LVALARPARRPAGEEIRSAVAAPHSKLRPWQSLAKRTGAVLQYLDTDENGLVTVEALASRLTSRTKLVAVTQISNVLGSLNPIRELAAAAHAEGAIFVMDGAQSVPHIPVDVRELDVDFMAFSGHKMLAPEGIGVLYGKRERLEAMEPVILLGCMLEDVTRPAVRLREGPQRFEPGTPNVAAAAGLDAAMDYLERAGFDRIAAIESELTAYLIDGLSQISGAQVYGSPSPEMHRGIVAFNLEGVHPHDVATFLDADGVAVRAGHHCAQPLMGHLGISSCCRASLYLYNTRADVEQCIQALEKVRRWFS